MNFEFNLFKWLKFFNYSIQGKRLKQSNNQDFVEDLQDKITELEQQNKRLKENVTKQELKSIMIYVNSHIRAIKFWSINS